MIDFELLPHTADLKIKVYGRSLEILFEHALQGMFQAAHPKTNSCNRINDRLVCSQLPIQRTVVVEGTDKVALLVNFLSEALYLSDVYNEAYLGLSIIHFDEKSLKGTLLGVPIQGFEGVEIKAVTYHDLEITYTQGIWQATIVFDI